MWDALSRAGWSGTFQALVERGAEPRRPRAVALLDRTGAAAEGRVVVIEFKETDLVRQADLDPVAAYARDLTEDHGYCRARRVFPVLVPTRYTGDRKQERGVIIERPDRLASVLIAIAREGGRQGQDHRVESR